MKLIKILPQHIANRIAAGEVIGRPDAVVKELIENSLDARAENVHLRIKDAGRTLIQVTDDASGMSYDDAVISFERHSTSKISTAEDMENIRTLGFRGEALASICAVSQVELKTKTIYEELGTLIKNYGSEVVENTRVQMEKGTSVTVKNLFYNTPARRNFLKSDQTEFRHIYDAFIRLAVSHPDVAFNFVNNDEEIFDLKRCGLKSRVEQIYGTEYSDTLIEAESGTSMMNLHGLISKPNFTKKNKQDQFLYLNNRYVYSRSLCYAVHLAYDDLIEKGDYPNFFIFLTLDAGKFDVNVHPSKLEVKFEDERTVFNLIRKSVRAALEKNDLVVKVTLADSRGGSDFISRSQYSDSGSSRTNFNPPSASVEHELRFNKYNSLISGETDDMQVNIHELFSGSETVLPEHEVKTELSSVPHKYQIWQFQNKYIMYQSSNTLMVIDQHAAHERILYEQALQHLASNSNLSQQLLIPVYVELNTVDYELALSLSDELRALGFNLEFSSKRKLKLSGIPSDVRLGNEEKIIQELIDEFKSNDVKLSLDKRDNVAKSFACKHAVRTGDKLNEEEMLNLIDRLYAAKMPYVCPHGRPTIIKIPIEELDKKFART